MATFYLVTLGPFNGDSEVIVNTRERQEADMAYDDTWLMLERQESREQDMFLLLIDNGPIASRVSRQRMFGATTDHEKSPNP